MFLRYAILILLCLSPFFANAEIKSLAGLPYHPYEFSSQISFYNLGNTAFAVDSIKENNLNFNVSYQYNYQYTSGNPEQNNKENIFSFSDIKDLYQGVFYHFNVKESNLKAIFGANAAFTSDSYNYNGFDQNPNLLTYAGKFLASAKYSDFYFGGFIIGQSIKVKNFNNSDYISTGSYLYADPSAKTNTNFYYQLALGYQFTEKLKIGFTFDNLYEINSYKDNLILQEDEIKSDKLVPYMVLTGFKTPFYRFNFSSTDGLGFLSNSYANYYYIEKMKNFKNYHFSTDFSYNFQLLNAVLKLDYFSLEYASDSKVIDQILMQYGAYSKTGRFDNLYYKLILTPNPLVVSSQNKWYFNLSFGGLLYSKLKESFIDNSDSSKSVNQDISFSQQKVDLTIGNKKNNKEFWFFFSYIHYTAYYSSYNNNLNWAGGGYPFSDLYNYDFSNNGTIYSKKSVNTVFGGFANRYHWKEFVFDLGVSFLYTKYPTGLKYAVLKTTTGASYNYDSLSSFFVSYELNISLKYQYNGIQDTGSNGTPSYFGGQLYSQEFTIGYKYKF